MIGLGGPAAILVLSQNTKRESGRTVQLGNINAGKAVADVIRSCLGPRAMLKMLMEPTGGILMTNDGNAILREITVQHPAAKSLIEISRTQDEEVGDGTTSVIVLAGTMLSAAEPFLLKGTHPTVIIRAYRQALEDAIVLLREKNQVSTEDGFTRLLELEEQYVHQQCIDILRVKPDLVFTEKGISDLASHVLLKGGVSAVRRLKKTDNNRLARATGACIVSQTSELQESDVGTLAKHFEISKIGDESYCFVTECQGPGACTILLRGPSKDVLKELDRNFHDALHVARCIILEPFLVPGGGATEMAVAHLLTEKAKLMTGVEQWPYRAAASALEVIPCTLAQNCGVNPVRVLTDLRAKHAEGDVYQNWGINGETGEPADMKQLAIFDPLAVKLQAYKTAVETTILLLRIDDIVSGSKKKKGDDGASQPAPQPPQGDD